MTDWYKYLKEDTNRDMYLFSVSQKTNYVNSQNTMDKIKENKETVTIIGKLNGTTTLYKKYK